MSVMSFKLLISSASSIGAKTTAEERCQSAVRLAVRRSSALDLQCAANGIEQNRMNRIETYCIEWNELD